MRSTGSSTRRATVPAARSNSGVPGRPGRSSPGQSPLSRRWICHAPGRDGAAFVLDHGDWRAPGVPTAAMDFDEHNQPRSDTSKAGVVLDSKQEGASAQEGRTIHGARHGGAGFRRPGPAAHTHLERGVTLQSEATSLETAGQTLHVRRTWRSPVADVDFRTIRDGGQEGARAQARRSWNRRRFTYGRSGDYQ